MKVDLNRLEDIGGEPTHSPRVIHRLRKFSNLAPWQKEGIITSACLGALCLTVTVTAMNLSPPAKPEAEFSTYADAGGANMAPQTASTQANGITITYLSMADMPEVPKEEPAAELVEEAPEEPVMEEAVGVIEETEVLDDTEETDAPEETKVEEPVEETEAIEETEEPEDEEDPEPEIVMANVETVLNVRADTSVEAEAVGLLYKDTGGTILEQKDGWTKIESGELIGWAKDEHLLFDEEAKAKADEAGQYTATIEAASLHVRTEPSTEADILGAVKENEVMKVADLTEDGWAKVIYQDKTGYISTEHADLEFEIAAGETMEEIKAREKTEKAAVENAELVVTVGYEGNASDLEMLATIIYCEAGNQPHEGKVAVGNVVLNRVRSSRFPNTIDEVLRAPRQFSPVGSGKYDRLLGSGRIPESCYQAAMDAMSGISFVGECLFFKNPTLAGAHPGIIIGNHVFW